MSGKEALPVRRQEELLCTWQFLASQFPKNLNIKTMAMIEDRHELGLIDDPSSVHCISYMKFMRDAQKDLVGYFRMSNLILDNDYANPFTSIRFDNNLPHLLRYVPE